MSNKLEKIECDFTVCKINTMEQIDFTREFVFLSKTESEISLVCESACVPPDAVSTDTGWKAFRISGILDFGLIGVIAKITDLLAKENISVFVVSTYNTDYIFVKAENFDRGLKTLIYNGYVIK